MSEVLRYKLRTAGGGKHRVVLPRFLCAQRREGEGGLARARLYGKLFGRQANWAVSVLHQAKQPQALFSQQFTHPKLAYVPNNPVAAGMVEK